MSVPLAVTLRRYNPVERGYANGTTMLVNLQVWGKQAEYPRFSSRENPAYLQCAGGHYIAGERMRDGSPHAAEALSRQGRYQVVRDNLRVKEVKLDSTSGVRRIICHNPEEADRAEG